MSTIKRFEDLHSWQEARKLVAILYGLTKKKEFCADFGLKDQVRRSAVSSMANIAEGFHRNSNKDFVKFLDYARSSVAETISHCYVALDQKYITEQEITEAQTQADITWKRINKFITYLTQSKRSNNQQKGS